MMSDSGRSREEKEAGWKRFDAWFEEKPPASNRGVTFFHPYLNQKKKSLCCFLREGILWIEAMENSPEVQADSTELAMYALEWEASADRFNREPRCDECETWKEEKGL